MQEKNENRLLAPLQGLMVLVKIHISHRALPCANANALSGQLLPEILHFK